MYFGRVKRTSKQSLETRWKLHVEVVTAAPAPNSQGTAAPINQLAKMQHRVSPQNVVRIGLNSLWTTAK